MLKVNSLSIEIDDEIIIKNISFSLEAGQLLHLKGKNGAGKTTLLRAILGLCPLSSGNILYQNKELTLNNNQDLGYISHKNSIESLLTVEENLNFITLGEATILTIEQVLRKIKLYPHRERATLHLSQGQKKRLSLARFFILDKKVWLMDEPFTALDVEHQQLLKQQMILFVKSGGSIIMTSHNSWNFDDINWQEFVL